MDKKPKTGDASRKAKKQKIEDKEQSERFIETAREIGVDESEKTFEEGISRIIRNRLNKAQK